MINFNIFYTLGYCFTYSLSSVLIKHLAHVSVNLALLITSIIAALTFNVFNIKNLKTIYQQFWQQRWLFLAMNFVVFMTWYFTYLAIQIGNPNIANFFFFMMLGCSGAIASRQIFKTILTLSVLVIPILINWDFRYAFLCGTVAGFSGYLYNVFSHQLFIKTKLGASQILAGRFYLSILFLFPYAEASKFTHLIVNTHEMLILIFIALMSFILPLYMAQRGLISLGVKVQSFLMTFVPLFTYVLQGLILHQWSVLMLILSVITPVILNDFIYKALFNKISP